MSNFSQNAANYSRQNRAANAASPVTQAERQHQANLYETTASFNHLFTNPAERVSVLHKIALDWAAEHGLTTPSVDYLIARMQSQIETKRAQLLQDEEWSEPTYRELQY